MLFSNRSKCNIESLFKITCSASSQIIGLLKTKPFMPLVKGGFSAFCIYFAHSNSAGEYLHNLCPLQWLKLILQPFA